MTPEELEKFIHDQLQGLPARRAPDSLESRVMSALEQQALIPWYHRSWSYWPAAMRSLFLVGALAGAAACVTIFYLGFNGLDFGVLATQAGERLGFFTKLYHVANWIADLAVSIFHGIPPLWLYGGLALIAALYATFLGLGAAAYRTLYRNN